MIYPSRFSIIHCLTGTNPLAKEDLINIEERQIVYSICVLLYNFRPGTSS